MNSTYAGNIGLFSFPDNNNGIFKAIPFIMFCSHISPDDESSQIRDCILALRETPAWSKNHKILTGHLWLLPYRVRNLHQQRWSDEWCFVGVYRLEEFWHWERARRSQMEQSVACFSSNRIFQSGVSDQLSKLMNKLNPSSLYRTALCPLARPE